MSEPIRAAYDMWPEYNRRFCDVVAPLTDGQLALPAGSHGWPIWAVVGHTACQRVFWLCDFAGEPGAETTPFPDAGHDCPGDDDLDTVIDAEGLVEALGSSFRIIAGCLDRWSLDMMAEVIRRPDLGGYWAHTRSSVLQRVFSHDVYHCAEVNVALGAAGLPQIDLWD